MVTKVQFNTGENTVAVSLVKVWCYWEGKKGMSIWFFVIKDNKKKEKKESFYLSAKRETIIELQHER